MRLRGMGRGIRNHVEHNIRKLRRKLTPSRTTAAFIATLSPVELKQIDLRGRPSFEDLTQVCIELDLLAHERYAVSALPKPGTDAIDGMLLNATT